MVGQKSGLERRLSCITYESDVGASPSATSSLTEDNDELEPRRVSAVVPSFDILRCEPASEDGIWLGDMDD